MPMYETFLFRASWRETLEGMKAEFGKEYAQDALWNLMTIATGGDYDTESPFVLKWLKGDILPLVDTTKGKFDGATENGRRGGRAALEVDMNTVDKMRQEGYSWQRISSYLSTVGVKITAEGLRKKYLKWQNSLQTVDEKVANESLQTETNNLLDSNNQQETFKNKNNNKYNTESLQTELYGDVVGVGQEIYEDFKMKPSSDRMKFSDKMAAMYKVDPDELYEWLCDAWKSELKEKEKEQYDDINYDTVQ